MATTASIRVVKQFTYRGVARTFSNRYHFTGGTPADSAHWTTLSDAVVLAEKAIFAASSAGGADIIGTVGYASGSEIPVFNKTYATPGTLSAAGLFPTPGDAAALVRYATAARTSKNHPLYLFNYYHGPLTSGTVANRDTLATTQAAAMGTYASNWVTGFSDGTNTLKRSGPNGNTATGYLVETLLTHRDLPR